MHTSDDKGKVLTNSVEGRREEGYAQPDHQLAAVEIAPHWERNKIHGAA